ncbi:MAG: thiamine phosphate synthase [Chloroflexi bacterium]|nr:thiamine phosphate synthase [Chloroflexota bacterium]
MTGERPVLPYPCLCLVTDPAVCPRDEMTQRVSAAVSGGVDVVQLRDKELPGAALLELAEELKNAIRGRALLLVNERVDVAVAAQVDGVQLGELGLPTDVSRRMLGDTPLIGRSVHSVEGAGDTVQSGADFLLVGTMFTTRSHPGEEPTGPGLLSRIKDANITKPMLGIGGITEGNVGQVMSAGAQGIAVITAVLADPNPGAAAERLKSAMADGSAENTRMNQAAGLPVVPR